MKKIFVVIIGIILLVASIYGCSVNNSSANNMSKYVGVYDNKPDGDYGDDHITLYLDSDGTYNYINRVGFGTTTLKGKGTWTISNNTIVFKSDDGSIERWDLSKNLIKAINLVVRGKNLKKNMVFLYLNFTDIVVCGRLSKIILFSKLKNRKVLF